MFHTYSLLSFPFNHSDEDKDVPSSLTQTFFALPSHPSFWRLMTRQTVFSHTNLLVSTNHWTCLPSTIMKCLPPSQNPLPSIKTPILHLMLKQEQLSNEDKPKKNKISSQEYKRHLTKSNKHKFNMTYKRLNDTSLNL